MSRQFFIVFLLYVITTKAKNKLKKPKLKRIRFKGAIVTYMHIYMYTQDNRNVKVKEDNQKNNQCHFVFVTLRGQKYK